MNTEGNSPSQSAAACPKPRRWPLVFAYIVFAFLLPASLGLALFGGATLNDSYSHDADRLWGTLAMVDAGFIFLASIAAILFLLRRSDAIWRAALLLLAFALAFNGMAIYAGFGMLTAAERRGGDWGALSIAGSCIFGIAFPAMLGAAAILGGVCLRLTRLSRSHAGS